MRLIVSLVFFCLSLPVLAVDSLRVGVAPDSAPLVFQKGGEIVGIEADNMRAISKIMGVDAQWVLLPRADLIPALVEGRVDVVMSALKEGELNDNSVLLTEPFIHSGQMAIFKADKALRFGKPWALYQPDTRVAVIAGTRGAQFVAENAEEAMRVEFSTADAALTALKADRVDLLIADPMLSWSLATEQGNQSLMSQYKPLTDESWVWAVGADNIRLRDSINQALLTMKANGVLDYILNRWIPVQISGQ